MQYSKRSFDTQTINLIKEIATKYNLTPLKEGGWGGRPFFYYSLEIFEKEVNWSTLVMKEELNENFIRLFQDKVDWIKISHHQKLSEEFIREFKDKVNWYWIARRHSLSKEFVNEFKKELANLSKEEVDAINECELDKMDKDFKYDPEWITGYVDKEAKRLSEEFVKLNMKYPDKKYSKELLASMLVIVERQCLPIVLPSSNKDLNENYIKDFKDKVSWYGIFSYPKLSEDFIREFIDKVNWYTISRCQELSEDFIREFKDNVDWTYISDNQKLSEGFIREFKDNVLWHKISSKQKLSESFIREFQDQVNWSQISIEQKLSEDFIREMKDKIEWNNISSSHSLSEDFIREFQDKVNWDFIVQKPYLSGAFKQDFSKELGLAQYMNTKMYSNELISLIKSICTDSGCVDEVIDLTSIDSKSISEFKQKVDWVYISRERILTEEFIREFKYNVNWKIISVNQKLSEDFIIEFADQLDWKYISIHQSLSENFIREFQDKVDWNEISKCQVLSEEFILEFTDKVNWEAVKSFQTYSSELEKRYNSFIQGRQSKLFKTYSNELLSLIREIAAESNIDLTLATEKFLKEFKEKVDWGYITFNRKLSEEFIREFQQEFNTLHWVSISFSQKLSESFIREFQDKVNWQNISNQQTLSEEFIREFADKVDWNNISKKQNLSDEFRKEFEKEIKKGQDQVNEMLKPNMKTQMLDGIKELGKSAAHGAELAIVGSAQEVAYNTVVSKLGISKELSNDPAFKAGIKLIIPALLFLGSVAFENKIPYLEYLKPILKMSVEETTRENTQMILDLLSEVGYAMYQAYIKPEPTNKKMRINIDYDSLKVPKLRSLAKEKGLTGYSAKKREEIITMLQESDSEENERSTNEYIN